MGYQTGIAKTIVNAEADYILAVKNNQKELYQATEDSFRFKSSLYITASKELDFGHGRIENRICSVCKDLLFVNQYKWKNIKSLVRIVSSRYNKTLRKEESTQIRYYISSLDEKRYNFNAFALTFITHNFELSALDMPYIYKNRWQIEIPFKWIKQNIITKHLSLNYLPKFI